MESIVTITSQGQITIPARMRRSLGISRLGKARIKFFSNKLTIEPVKDLLEMGGILRDRAIKNKSIQEIIELEHKAVERAVAERYRKKTK